jgi:competence protein ComEC
VIRLHTGSPLDPRRWLDHVRAKGAAVLATSLDGPRNGLAAAILLGQRDQIPYEDSEPFVTTGTVHLLVVSGLHVGLLAIGLLGGLRLGLFPRRYTLLAVAVLVAFYAAVSGANPPAVRAAVLVGAACAAGWMGRRTSGMNALAIAAIVVLAINPADLFRTGPQLSFLAVATLGWLAQWRWNRTASLADDPDRRLAALIRDTRPWPVRAIRTSMGWFLAMSLASLMIWLACLPLVMARFHLATPVAIVLSPILWLPVAACLFFGFAALSIGWLIPPAGSLLGGACDAILALVERLVVWGDSLPGGHLWVTGPSDWWMWGFYGGLAICLSPLGPSLPGRWRLGLLAAWIAVGFTPPLARATDSDRFACTFLSVGHGCCTVLELPGGKTILYDAGRLGSPAGGARTIASFLWSRGVTRIDAVVISHADADHYNALPELLKRFPVGVVYVSPQMFRDRSQAGLIELERRLAEADVPIREIWAGDRLVIADDAGGRPAATDRTINESLVQPPASGFPPAPPGVEISVRHPTRDSLLENDNANSLLLWVEYRGVTILLPGDLESPGLEAVLAEAPQDCDILLAPHHGSSRSDPPGFASWCSPEFVVISGGSGDSTTSVVDSYSEAGRRVFHTAQRGAVTFRIDDAAIKISAFVANDP